MKTKLIFLSSLFLLTLQAKEISLPEITKVIPLSEFSSELVQEISSGRHPDLAIECSQGTALPIKLLCKHKLISLSLNPEMTLNVDRSFYLRCVGKKAYVSFDLELWENAKHLLQESLFTSTKVGINQSSILIEVESE